MTLCTLQMKVVKRYNITTCVTHNMYVACAVVASNNAVSDPTNARKLGRASIGISFAGIAVTAIILIVIVLILIVDIRDSAGQCEYKYYGNCYRHKSYVGPEGYCSGVKDTHDRFCYYD